jgi:Ca2+-transporting ATPase
MQRPPRDSREPILAGRHWRLIATFGALMTLGVLGALALSIYWLRLPEPQAVTVSFLTLAMAQLWHVFNLRSPASHWLRNDIVQSKYIWGALALCVALLVVALYVPAISEVMRLEPPGPRGLGLALGMSLLPLVIGQLFIVRRRAMSSS